MDATNLALLVALLLGIHPPLPLTASSHRPLYWNSTTNRYTEPADYTNHSCDPNAGFGGSPVTLVAMKEIAVGVEITFDYAMCECIEHLTGNCDWECKCGTATCRGMFTGADWRRPELWERYGNYFSPYLLRKINYLRTLNGTPAASNTAVSTVFPSIEKCLVEQAERDARQAAVAPTTN